MAGGVDYGDFSSFLKRGIDGGSKQLRLTTAIPARAFGKFTRVFQIMIDRPVGTTTLWYRIKGAILVRRIGPDSYRLSNVL